MRKIIGLLAIIVTSTLLLFTQDTSEFMFIVYLLILYLGNSFLISKLVNNDLVPLLTTTEIFYILDFYLLLNNDLYGSIVFCFLAVAFSFLSIVCLVKEVRRDLPKEEIANEPEHFEKMRKVSLVLCIIAFVYNIILLGLIDYSVAECVYPLAMLIMTLLMTSVIVYQGFIGYNLHKQKSKAKKEMLVVSAISGNINTFNINKKENNRYKGLLISNRPYFMLSIFYLLFLPFVLNNESNIMRIVHICFFVYIFVVMYYPLSKCEFYGFRKNDSKYRISWKEHFKKSFVCNLIFLLCGITLSFTLYYVHNSNVDYQGSRIHSHDSSISFTEEDYDKLELEVRNDYEGISYVGFESNDNEFTNDSGEKYKRLYIYVYTDESDIVYLYKYIKYTTTSPDHKKGEIEAPKTRVIADFDKTEIGNRNISFF